MPRSIGARLAVTLAACALGALAAIPALSLAMPAASGRASRTSSHRRAGSHGSSSHGQYVSGRVSLAGYTIAVVGFNGKTVLAGGRSFRLRAPDSRVTLQLIDSHGVYAGPVVVGGAGKRVITGLRAGVNVGLIDVVPSAGYGRLARPLPSRDVVSSRWAYAHAGVPIGNGRNLGLVLSPSKDGGSGPGEDEAHVGIPNLLDIAVPGTRVLKNLAPAGKPRADARHGARAASSQLSRRAFAGPVARIAAGGEVPSTPPAQPSAPPAGEGAAPAPGTAAPAAGAPGSGAPAPARSLRWMSQMFLEMNETINADAAGVTPEEIDSTLQSKSNLKLLGLPTGASLLELDCNGLTFCSQGGTGQAVLEGLAQNASAPAPGTASSGPTQSTVPFPGGSLDGADGFGELIGPNVPDGLLGEDANGAHEFSLDPDATSSQIGSGDVITALVTEDGVTTQAPTTIGFVFDTVPAIASYSDTAGDSAAIAYPDTSNLGTPGDPIKVAAGPNGDVVMTFTVYRPQRQGIAGAGEPAFVDIGHLGYELDYATAPTPGSTVVGSTQAPQCSASVYSNLSSTLSLVTGGEGGEQLGEHSPPNGAGELIDSAEDQPANPADTISFTADLTQCLAAKGVSSFPVGQPVAFDISANSQSSDDHANQKFTVERVR